MSKDKQKESSSAEPNSWIKLEKAGQVRVGDKLCFTIGDKTYNERAKLILHAGTDKEEVIYDKGRNFYFITSMVLSGTSNHKNMRVLPRAAPAKPLATAVASTGSPQASTACLDANDARALYAAADLLESHGHDSAAEDLRDMALKVAS